jgi:magnesium chelatase subunit I
MNDDPSSTNPVPLPGSLRELIDLVTGRAFIDQSDQEDAGLAEVLPFPFLGLVG